MVSEAAPFNVNAVSVVLASVYSLQLTVTYSSSGSVAIACYFNVSPADAFISVPSVTDTFGAWFAFA